MSVRDVIVDTGVKATPPATYLGAVLADLNIPLMVSILSGVLVLLQIYFTVLKILDVRKKDKEAQAVCQPSEKD